MKPNRLRFTILFVLLVALPFTANAQTTNQAAPTANDLVAQFKNEKVFWRQLEIAKQIVALKDRSVLPEIVPYLSNEDRHIRGNAALVAGGLGDPKALDVIAEIITDRSDRPPGQGQVSASSDGQYHVASQIRADRYYAVNLLAQLKDPRAVPILVPLLNDYDLNYEVAWALGQIGDKTATQPLIESLRDDQPGVRVAAIQALEKLHATEALPALRELLNDKTLNRSNPLVTVSEVARAAITTLEAPASKKFPPAEPLWAFARIETNVVAADESGKPRHRTYVSNVVPLTWMLWSEALRYTGPTSVAKYFNATVARAHELKGEQISFAESDVTLICSYDPAANENQSKSSIDEKRDRILKEARVNQSSPVAFNWDPTGRSRMQDLQDERLKAGTAESIDVVVTGVLHFEEGHGYFISVRANSDFELTSQVWLRVTEDKVLYRRLQGLLNKRVVAKGELQQMPDNITSAFPKRAMYLARFEIAGATN